MKSKKQNETQYTQNLTPEVGAKVITRPDSRAHRHRALVFVLIGLAVMVAVWSTLFMLKPKQETLDQRVQNVASQLKCPVCQGESVADSQAAIARQMRQVIGEQLQSGKSEQDIVQYFVHSYGDQIIWLPPWQGFTLLIWLVPMAFLLGGIVLVLFVLREWKVGRSAIGARSVVREKKIVLDTDLEPYRVQFEAELAEEDPLFRQSTTDTKS